MTFQEESTELVTNQVLGWSGFRPVTETLSCLFWTKFQVGRRGTDIDKPHFFLLTSSRSRGDSQSSW